MTAPVGAIVRLYVDLRALVTIDDIIETQTGRRYQVLGARAQLRGRHIGRQHLQCLVVPPNWSPPPDAAPTVHRIRWYRRRGGKRRPAGRLRGPR